MKIHLSYRGLASHNGFEQLVTHYCSKMEKLLATYDPDLVQCHGVAKYRPKKSEYALSVSIVLPTATLHSVNTAKDVHSTVQRTFTDLENQLKKHKDKLRHDHEWKRKRGRPRVSRREL